MVMKKMRKVQSINKTRNDNQPVGDIVEETPNRSLETRIDIPDMQELSVTQVQEMRDNREDDNLEGNMLSAARNGDLSPRQIDNMKSGKKKTIPLQVKTRSNKDKPEDERKVEIIMDSVQQVTLRVKLNNKEFYLTVVYARCSVIERLELWDAIEKVAEQSHKPWLIGGDFNVILNEEEKQGGLPFMQSEAIDFAQCINNCGLVELKYSEVHHLTRRGSDHAPLHVICSTEEEPCVKPFRFLNFWTKHHQGADRSKLEGGLRGEAQLVIHPLESNRSSLKKAEAELKKYWHIEEEYWKQKSGMRWFKDGDRNNKFFHNFVKARRERLRIHDMQKTQDGDTITSTKEIGAATVAYFEEQFREDSCNEDYGLLQECWDILKEDVTNMVREFFSAQHLPRFITHMNLILIPKKEKVKTFGDLRLISLSTFVNKIISRMLHERLIKCLPLIISRNQPDFVKGRNITENVLLAQEIIRDIKLRSKDPNVVVKLDMAKTYDRVS
ncbi:uncharacterized protein [Solanum tuberosum]|uniref:uncharacterized protein n=1 Tax=Solanum tuberosum TaxID=4113 RepID=UPI00073A4C55|nr:PREDICTED: uncharacterized protein LOC107061055 [Solanum tuberosum]